MTLQILTILFLFPNTDLNDNILGNWMASGLENATIEIYKDIDNLYYGKIVACDEPDWIGEMVVRGVEYDLKKGKWVGEIYSLKRKMKINATFELIEHDQKLKVTGKKAFITKTFFWNRI